LVVLTMSLFAQLAIVTRAPIDTSAGVNFHALLAPDTVYVGQQATYQVGVFIDDQLRLRLRHNPEFVPPDPLGMLAYELNGAARVPESRRVGRHNFEVHVFQRAFFPLAPGHYTIPSAQLVYSLPLSTSFFSREETHTLVAESLSVVARAPPAVGRPTDYLGAVGDLTMAARLDSAAARVGDPMLLTLSVGGRGNIKLLPRPTVALSWGSLVPGQVRVRLDTTSEQVRGTKEFDWLITPRDSGDLPVPSIRYPYFDPYTERYEIAVTRPSTVHVASGALALGDTARTEGPPPLAIRTAYRGTPEAPLYESPLYLALALSAPVPALALAVRRRPRRPSPSGSAAAALQALGRSKEPVDAIAARRVFVRALEERFTLPPTVLTDRGALSHALRLEGVTAAAAEATEAILMTLDRGAFGVGEALPPDVSARAYAVYREVISEARKRRSTPDRGRDPIRPRGSVVALAVASALAATMAAHVLVSEGEAPDAAAFAAGVRAYVAGNYRAAATHFAAVTALSPRAPDGWANAGTAAWAAGDTVDAVVGWQRAGRLEPLARDVRERLALVRAPQEGPIARLPRVPPPLAADIALGCWLLACATAAWRRGRRRRPGLPAISVVCAVLAIGAAVEGVLSNEAAVARHLVVVDRGTALYASPALDAEHASRVEAGDIARVSATEGVWSHVRLDSDREGWVESARLISIANGR
jgi:hypothetical protein